MEIDHILILFKKHFEKDFNVNIEWLWLTDILYNKQYYIICDKGNLINWIEEKIN